MSAERVASFVLAGCAVALVALGASIALYLVTGNQLNLLLGFARANIAIGALGLVVATGTAVVGARAARPVRVAGLACLSAALAGGLGALAFLHWFLADLSLSGAWH